MNKHTHKKAAAKAVDNVRTVTYTKSERDEILRDAKTACKDADIRPTKGNLRIVITDELGEAVAEQLLGKGTSSVATEDLPPVKKPARKTTTKPARRFVFGFSVSAVARALGKAGVKPADAVAAIHRHEPSASVAAIRTFVQAGRHGLRGKPAPLSKPQLKTLVAATA